MDVADDGRYYSPPVGRWAEQKHDLVAYYAKLFSEGMKNKWHERVYIDLYAGAGYSKLKNSDRIIAGSPIQALLVTPPFDKYIFCEKGIREISALRDRVDHHLRNANVTFISGDCNENVDNVLDAIPPYSIDHRVLSLCFVDPFDIGIKFATLRKLASRRMDFLILLALYMDANRNYDNYVKEEAPKIGEFLGSSDWRRRWIAETERGKEFPQFLAEEFSRSMEALSYKQQPFYKTKAVTIPEKNVRLYRLALFSRHSTAYKFWDQVLKYTTPQQLLDFGKSDGE